MTEYQNLGNLIFHHETLHGTYTFGIPDEDILAHFFDVMVHGNFSNGMNYLCGADIEDFMEIYEEEFKIEEDKRQEEKNIKTTLLLDPKNEEAMFLLIDMELERSNFSKADELSKDFKKICVDMCEKIASIESRLKDFERKDAS